MRFDFRLVEDENGDTHELKVGHAWIEPPGPEGHAVPNAHDETLHENLYSYELIARSYLNARLGSAMKVQKQMLDETRLRQYEPLTVENLGRYVGDYRALGSDKRGVMRKLGDLWGVTPRTARRRLERAEEEGLLPEGLPRRRRSRSGPR